MDSSPNLTQLQKDLANALSISHYYQTNLSYLKEHCSTIEINIHNYKKRIELISQKDNHSDLVLLEKFTEFATEKCLNQLQTDYQTLSAGFKPLEKFIITVQGIIEIEKTKNERILNKTIAIASDRLLAEVRQEANQTETIPEQKNRGKIDLTPI